MGTAVAPNFRGINIMPKTVELTMFESHVIRARVDKTRVNPIYIHALYRSQFAKSEIMKRAKTATMTTIGQDTIYELPCPIPPLPEQEQFTAVVRRAESLRGRAGESERQGEGLFQSMLSKAFLG